MDSENEKPPKDHALKQVWESNSEVFAQESALLKPPPIEGIFADFFSVGEYYYVLDIVNGTLRNHHENILKMHSLKKVPNLLNEIIALIHPEDMPPVIAAEEMYYNKIKEIGTQHL